MAGQLDRKELHRLARLGAEARLIALEQERADILRNFPGLAGASKAASRGGGRAAAPRRRRQSRMSAAARKAVSVRMKKYWAERRKGKNA